jgi:hypothetical protein
MNYIKRRLVMRYMVLLTIWTISLFGAAGKQLRLFGEQEPCAQRSWYLPPQFDAAQRAALMQRFNDPSQQLQNLGCTDFWLPEASHEITLACRLIGNIEVPVLFYRINDAKMCHAVRLTKEGEEPQVCGVGIFEGAVQLHDCAKPTAAPYGSHLRFRLLKLLAGIKCGITDYRVAEQGGFERMPISFIEGGFMVRRNLIASYYISLFYGTKYIAHHWLTPLNDIFYSPSPASISPNYPTDALRPYMQALFKLQFSQEESLALLAATAEQFKDPTWLEREVDLSKAHTHCDELLRGLLVKYMVEFTHGKREVPPFDKATYLDGLPAIKPRGVSLSLGGII